MVAGRKPSHREQSLMNTDHYGGRAVHLVLVLEKNM